jgi:hypothetical protein
MYCFAGRLAAAAACYQNVHNLLPYVVFFLHFSLLAGLLLRWCAIIDPLVSLHSVLFERFCALFACRLAAEAGVQSD